MKILKYCLWIPFLCAFSTFAQQTPPTAKTVSGTVINHRGEPLANANVTIKSGRGTVTNAQGKFSLKNVSDDDDLSVSFIGYARQTIPVKRKSTFRIALQPAKNELDEVVVQGYGITSKRLATGNITTVSAEEIEKHPVTNPIRVLQGLVPGAVITNATGSSSSAIKIEIRGRNTINPAQVSEPLYIVDGVPMTILNLNAGSVNNYVGGTIISQGSIQSGVPSKAGAGQSPFLGINPNDIESIEVLKDADATAIFGSRASNGVILITTKKGHAGKTHAEVRAFTGYSQVPRYYSLLNTQQYLKMREEALRNDGRPINAQTAPDLVLWDTTRYTDWQKYSWGRLGNRLSTEATLSGGDVRTSFRAGAGYDYDKDIVTEKGGNHRGSFSLNLSHKSLNQKFGFIWSVVYSISYIDIVNRPGAVLLPPNAPPVYDNNGKLNYSEWRPGSFPFGSLLETYISKTNFLNSNMTLSYEIIKGLTVSSSIGYNNSQNDQTSRVPIASQDPSLNPTGSLRLGHTYFHNLILEPKIEYLAFISKGRLSILGGATVQQNKTEGYMNSGINYTSDLLLNSINSAPNKNLAEYNGEYKYSGVFGRINYNRGNKYLLNINIRRDGSSRFGAGQQFGNFGSAGAAWIFSEEKWIKNTSFFSFGKLRASYGITGSDNIPDYAYLSRWRFGTNGTYNSNLPVTPVGFSDSLLQWEVNKKLEVSANLGFIKDKISLEVSWYRNRCDNQLVAFPTAAFTGFTSVISNTPAKVQNMGWEFILAAKIFDGQSFKWSLKSSMGINRNKLIDYPNLSQSPYKNRLVIGKSLSIQRFLHYIGVDPQNGEYLFEDFTKDGNIVLGEDDTYLLNMSPKFDGGVTSNFTWENWELGIFFYFRKQKGTDIMVASGVPGVMVNQGTDVLNRWQKPGDITNTGKFTTLSTPNGNFYYTYSDARVSDASFIRLQNISLSYQFPGTVKERLRLANLKIYFRAENLFFFTKYKGIDPEVQTLGSMPYPRILTAGFVCNF